MCRLHFVAIAVALFCLPHEPLAAQDQKPLVVTGELTKKGASGKEQKPGPFPLLAKPTLQIADDFKADSLKNYRIQGDVRYQPGLVRIPTQGSLVRPIKGGPLIDLSLELEFPALAKNGDASETWIAFEPQGIDQFGLSSVAAGEPLLVAFRRVRKDDKIVGELRIHTMKSLKDVTPTSGPGQFLRQTSWPQDSARQSLRFRYQHGLVSVYGPDGYLLAGYRHNFCANIKSVGIFQRAGELACTQLKIEGEAEPKLPSVGERVSLMLAASADSEARRLKAAGKFDDAAAPALSSLATCEKIFGPKHFYTLRARSLLAEISYYAGDHAAAFRLLSQTADLRKETVGQAHPDYSANLNFLGLLFDHQGDYAKAESLYKQVAKIDGNCFGEDHERFGTALHNLGSCYLNQRNFAEAEPLLKRAVAIQRRAVGKDHVKFAASLENLGVNYMKQGDLAKAEPILDEAMELRRRNLGNDHPLYGVALHNLAALYLEQDKVAKAEPLFREALAIARARLGENHPDLTPKLTMLAQLLCRDRRAEEGERLSRQAVQIMRRHLEESAHVQSERQQIVQRHQADLHLQAHLLISADLPSVTVSTYGLVLSWKGAVTARQRLTRLARSGLAKDADAKKLFDELDQLSRQISTWTSMSPDAIPAGIDLPKKLSDLSARREETETKLAMRTESFRPRGENLKLTPADLQKLLPEGAVLVDFVEYHGKLAAFVVTRDALKRVEFGPIAPLADAADRFRLSMKRATPAAGKDDPARFLRAKLLEPLGVHLGKAKLLLIAPDGPLHSLPFGALPGKENGKYLLEEMPIAVIPVPQILPELLNRRGAAGAAPSMLAIGDVDFDGKLIASADAKDEPGWKRTRAGEPMKWERLPGTKAEIAAIESAFRKAFPQGKLMVLRDGEPTEGKVRDLAPRYEFVHLATHGFFAPTQIKSALQPQAGMRDPQLFGAPAVAGHHPGLLSGIVLAGANHPKGEDDGVLTALEVSELDLSKVELAVLSACETGLGETAGGEGVLGLQRAFQIAGARTVVTTLWSIPDEPTRVLIERFYANRLAKKVPTLEALREAQLWMLREGRSHADVQRGIQRLEKTPEPLVQGRLAPYYWAAFVLSGDWR